jgi:Flp pilus assembly protein TadG
MVISVLTAVLVPVFTLVLGAVLMYFVLRNSKNGVQKTVDEAVARVEQKVDAVKDTLDKNSPLP